MGHAAAGICDVASRAKDLGYVPDPCNARGLTDTASEVSAPGPSAKVVRSQSNLTCAMARANEIHDRLRWTSPGQFAFWAFIRRTSATSFDFFDWPNAPSPEV